jgi:prepilin-type N-terminal cleavage/methylation domain-containing protein
MKQKARHSGFTLAEIAVVLAIIGIALTMGLKMLTATFENSAYSETRAKQERIKLALVSFMRSNGRLPCPDTATPATGNEVPPPAIPPAAPASCNLTAAAGYGVVPWVTLQIPRDAVLDGWGNFFSYRVANSFAPVIKNWTSKTVGTPFDINELRTSSTALIIQERDTPASALNQITNQAVVVLLSHGKNGLGALTTRGAARVPPPTVAIALDENTNGAVGARTFVRRALNDSAQTLPAGANPGGPFDDVVAYMTPQDLLQPLVTERTIYGKCSAYCSTGPATCPVPPLPPAPQTNICSASAVPVGLTPINNCTCTPGQSLPE